MVVKKIVWLSEIALGAMVTISDGSFECEAFGQPCNVIEGQVIIDPLLTEVSANIWVVYDEPLCLIKETRYFFHEVVAELVDKSKHLVRIGQITLEVEGYFPGDSKNGDMVKFYADKIYV
jgi:hypothetical protein